MNTFKMSTAIKSEATGKPSVPVEQWGTDHWSTFAYLDCRAVDHKGLIDIDLMRCDAKRHPGLINRANRNFPQSKHPTLLANGVKKPDHDDWDCFEDLIAMGLCTWEGSGIHPYVAFTEKGRVLVAKLRTHKAAGGQFREFDPGTFWADYGHTTQGT
jgi:hypothetical protein